MTRDRSPIPRPEFSAPGPRARRREADSPRSHLVRIAFIGALTGCMAILLFVTLKALEGQRRELLERMRAYPRWGWAVLPTIGLVVGCAVGWITRRLDPGWYGRGMSHVKGAMLRTHPINAWVLVPLKFIGSALGIGVGLSLGRQDPTIQIGAAIGQGVGRLFRSPDRVVAQLVACGAGAGLAGAFNAPLAGFIFVLEELRRELSSVVYTGALVASIAASIVARSMTEEVTAFHVAAQVDKALTIKAYPTVIAIGVLGGLLGALFGRLLVRTGRLGRQQSIFPAWMLPGIAAALCGLAAWFLPQVIGSGHELTGKVLNDQLAVTSTLALGTILLGRFVLTLLCFGSGAPGGIFGPVLLMGAIFGTLLGRLNFHGPEWMWVQPAQMAILGMAAVFTGCVRAPLTGIVLMSEITGDYDLLLPTAITCACAYLVAERASVPPIYDYLLAEDLKERELGAGEVPLLKTVFGVQFRSALDGSSLNQVSVPTECTVVSIERGTDRLAPSNSLRLLAGDRLTVVVNADAPQALDVFGELCTGY